MRSAKLIRQQGGVTVNKGFLQGMGTVVALFTSEREAIFSLPSHSDEEAIRKDWQQVGNDIRCVAENLHRSKTQKKS